METRSMLILFQLSSLIFALGYEFTIVLGYFFCFSKFYLQLLREIWYSLCV